MARPLRIEYEDAFYHVMNRGRGKKEKKGTLPFFVEVRNTSLMPRLARTVCAGLPHHITQRGNRREDVFFLDEDREVYLAWLQHYCSICKVHILAHCLMTNHVYLIAVPQHEDGLKGVLKPLHMRYAQRINRKHGWSGHLWQGRFLSSPLDEAYL